MARRAVWKAIGVAIIGMVLAALAFFTFGKTPDYPQTMRLPDGSELSLIGATFGTNHLSPGVLPRKVLEFIPDKLLALLRLRQRTSTHSPEPSLCAWFERKGAPATGTSIDLLATLAGDDGSEVAVNNNYFPLWGGSPGAMTVPMGQVYSAFPRENARIRLALYERDARTMWKPVRLGKFEIPNPSITAYSPWRAGPPTARDPTNDFEATIKKLVIGRGTEMENSVSSDSPWLAGCAVFEVRERGQITTNWAIEQVAMSDASGNSLVQNSWSCQVEDGNRVAIRFAPALWVGDSAWKLRVEFVRTPGAHFETNELMTFTNVPVPATNSASYGNWKTNFQGFTLEMQGLAGVYGTLTNASVTSGSSRGHIATRLSPQRDGWNLSVPRMVDDQGAAHDVSWNSRGGGEYVFQADFPTNSPTVDITFAVHKSRYLEFMATPEIFKKEKAAR